MPNKFITLTHKLRPHLTSPQAFAFAKRAFSRLVKRIRRLVGTFEYAAVWELTRAGNPHLHIAARSDYIPQSWLSHQWRILAGAPVVDIRAVKNPHKVAKYVVKYMLKAPTLTVEAMQGGRLIQISKHYLPDPHQPDSARAREAWSWRWLDRSFASAAADLDKGFDAYTWTQDHTGAIHIVAPPGHPLALNLISDSYTADDFQRDYARDASRLEAELPPNTSAQLTFPR